MAEACRIGSCHTDVKGVNSREESVCIINVFCVFISLVTILADLTTDLTVFAEYCTNGYIYWSIATLICIVAPNVLINIFSLRWIVLDQKSSLRHWITHCFLIGLLERYAFFLLEAFTCKSIGSAKNQKLLTQRNDLSLLHFLYTFTGTVPQILLQSYAIVILDGNYQTKALALTASISSVLWACSTYIYSITTVDVVNFQWRSISLKLVWHFGMLVARIFGILLFTTIFGVWSLVILGLHWAAMTFWIVTQKTTFCPNKLEETFYNVVMGFVYCFCYINLRDGHTRYRLLTFYTLMVTQNFGSLFLYVLIADMERQRKIWSLVATISIVAGTVIGMCGMILYYRWFHEKGPIMWKNVQEDIELNNKVTPKNNETKDDSVLCHVRSFKSQKDSIVKTNARNDTSLPDHLHQSDIETTDKKFLLDHLIARSGTPMFVSAPVGNSSMDLSSIEFHTVENTPQVNMQTDDITPLDGSKNTKFKKRIICPTELMLKLSSLENIESSIDEISTSNMNSYKRRGICSSDELRDDLTKLNIEACNLGSEHYMKSHKTDQSSEISQDTDGSNKKTSSDSIDLDLDLSFSDINSSDINTFNENIVQKLCLSALKNIKVGNQDADIENIQRIALDILREMYAKKGKNKNNVSSGLFLSKQRDVDTPTEMLSVHDYENICAVNIAREAWGLRSWNGYCDIENWLHDGSVVRDRRRDTLTSASSEISSCISQELKNYILTAPPFPKKAPTYSNIFVRFDKPNQVDYVNTACDPGHDETFLAKPCFVGFVDIKDSNQLEPILEELDDLGDIDPPNKKRLNSETSLVATIDEIRKATVTNSPRNLYHRRDHIWDSQQLNGSAEKIETNLKRALWKEPSKFNSNNIMESFPEKENMPVVPHKPKIAVRRKELNVSESSSLVLSNPEIVSKYTKRTHKSNNIRKNTKKVNNGPDDANDLSNKDIDLLWKLVSENTVPSSSVEDLTSSQITSSLQSLISKDDPRTAVTSSAKNSNVKKTSRNRPRRKFSILRERFEPRTSRNVNQEILYSEKNTLPMETSVVNVNNKLCDSRRKACSESKQKQINFDQHVCPASMTSKNIKEKRTLFTKQVLSPPKFNTKLKHKV